MRLPGITNKKANMIFLLIVKQCRFCSPILLGSRIPWNWRRDRHTKRLGLAIARFRRCEHVPYDPKGLHEFIVESHEPGSQHRLTRKTFDDWLRRPGGSPAEVGLRTRVKAILGESNKRRPDT